MTNDARQGRSAPAGVRSAPAPGGRILLGHGSGGKLYRDLVKDVFVSAFANPLLARLDDAVALAPSGRIAFTTDSHVVQPLRFPGGDIGRLAVAGTVNDLATAAARPLALAAAFVIEEGFALDELRAVCASMAATAREARVPIVTGDTKVVERGACDGLFITTTGVGEIVVGHELGCAAVRAGDAVVLSGGVGDHAVAVLAARGEFKFSADVCSDCAPLWGLVEAAVAAVREAGDGAGGVEAGGEEALRFLRDPTRGGLATVLAELAEEAGLGIEVEEDAVLVSPAVRSVCDLLGYDPLTLANEGKMVLVVAPEAADVVVAAIQRTEYGREARRIGFVTAAHPGRVALRTQFGTRRVLDMPVGELLPRIC
jgi:hydrogenase expression/formation protein HypE